VKEQVHGSETEECPALKISKRGWNARADLVKASDIGFDVLIEGQRPTGQPPRLLYVLRVQETVCGRSSLIGLAREKVSRAEKNASRPGHGREAGGPALFSGNRKKSNDRRRETREGDRGSIPNGALRK